MKTEGIYTNRENERWEVGNITRHPWAPLAFVMAVRIKDGKQVCLHKHRLKFVAGPIPIPETVNPS